MSATQPWEIPWESLDAVRSTSDNDAMTDFNGWTNRETWALNLHMSNNQGDQEYWEEEAYNSCRFAADLDEAVDELASRLETWLDDLYSAIENAATTDGESVTREAWSLFCDVGSNTSASVINYDEIAKSWIEDIAYDWDED